MHGLMIEQLLLRIYVEQSIRRVFMQMFQTLHDRHHDPRPRRERRRDSAIKRRGG